MAKKKTTTKLDATVKVTESMGAKYADKIPPYTKPCMSVVKNVHQGDIITIKKRKWDEINMTFFLVDGTGEVVELTPNALIWVDDEGKRHGTPLWAIHDWEIIT